MEFNECQREPPKMVSFSLAICSDGALKGALKPSVKRREDHRTVRGLWRVPGRGKISSIKSIRYLQNTNDSNDKVLRSF